MKLIKRSIDKIKPFIIDILFGIILLLYLIKYIPNIDNMHDFCTVPYLLSYDFGFISRGFIGSILECFSSYITQERIWAIIGLNQIFLCVVVVLYLKLIRENSGEKYRNIIIYLSLIFLINPSSVAFLFGWENYGRFDLFMILGTIIVCTLIIKNKLLGFLPIICLVMLLIHQGFIFSYFPCIVILLCFNADNSKKKWSMVFITCLICAMSFLYLQFLGKITVFSYEQVIQHMSERTNFNVGSSDMVKFEYFTSVFDFIPLFILPNIKVYFVQVFFVLLLMLPLELMIVKIWRGFARAAGDRRLYIIPILIIISTLPKFILTCDWGRDLSSIFISQFLLIFSLLAMNNKSMQWSIEKFQEDMSVHSIFSLFAVVELAAIGKFEAANILDITKRIVYLIKIIINKL